MRGIEGQRQGTEEPLKILPVASVVPSRMLIELQEKICNPQSELVLLLPLVSLDPQ